jgi:hypothetical protein
MESQKKLRSDLVAKKKWRDKNKDTLANIQINKKDKILLEQISEQMEVNQKQVISMVLDFFIKTKNLVLK